MKKSVLWVVFIVVLLGFVTVLYLRQQERAPDIDTAALDNATLMQETQPPAIRHPIPEPPVEEEAPLPSLDESDPALRDRFAAQFDRREFRELIFLDQLIRRIVVTIDNLPRKTIPQKFLPLRPPGDAFIPQGEENALVISSENYKRYNPYVRLAEAIAPEKLAAVYVRFYPLFQQAYEELGYPNAYFNDRLVEVLDHLLATPEVHEPVTLVRPKVVYLFADPELEELSAGQKLLIRLGPGNAAVIKNSMRQLRHEVGSLPVTTESIQ